MLAMNLTRVENEILARILEMPGLTTRILRSAMYRLRKQSGLCITTGCRRNALPNEARCEHCQSLNRLYATTHRKKEKKTNE